MQFKMQRPLLGRFLMVYNERLCQWYFRWTESSSFKCKSVKVWYAESQEQHFVTTGLSDQWKISHWLPSALNHAAKSMLAHTEKADPKKLRRMGLQLGVSSCRASQLQDLQINLPPLCMNSESLDLVKVCIVFYLRHCFSQVLFISVISVSYSL